MWWCRVSMGCGVDREWGRQGETRQSSKFSGSQVPSMRNAQKVPILPRMSPEGAEG